MIGWCLSVGVRGCEGQGRFGRIWQPERGVCGGTQGGCTCQRCDAPLLASQARVRLPAHPMLMCVGCCLSAGGCDCDRRVREGRGSSEEPGGRVHPFARCDDGARGGGRRGIKPPRGPWTSPPACQLAFSAVPGGSGAAAGRPGAQWHGCPRCWGVAAASSASSWPKPESAPWQIQSIAPAAVSQGAISHHLPPASVNRVGQRGRSGRQRRTGPRGPAPHRLLHRHPPGAAPPTKCAAPRRPPAPGSPRASLCPRLRRARCFAGGCQPRTSVHTPFRWPTGQRLFKVHALKPGFSSACAG